MPKPRSLDGCDNIIDRWLGLRQIGQPPQYQHDEHCQFLSESPPSHVDGVNLISNLLDQIERNWKASRKTRTREPSRENWRFTKVPIRTAKNRPEVTLERRIVQSITDETWANQIPTCSGLVDSYTDKRRAIDLAHRKTNLAEFLELKLDWGSGTPLFAAFEILGYGLLYYFSRCHMQELGYSVEQKPLLGANEVRLIVLAPSSYYESANFGWLETALDQGLSALMPKSGTDRPRMSFRFEMFPREFALKCSDQELKQSLAKRRNVY